MKLRTWKKYLCAGLIVSLLLAACSGGQPGGSASQPAAETTAETTAEESTAATQETSSGQETAEAAESIVETSASNGADNAAPAGNEKKEAGFIQAPEILVSEFPSMDGSTATLPLGKMIYRLCTGVDEKTADKAVEFTKTTNAYVRLMDKEADLVVAYEPGPKAKEDKRFEEILMAPIGLDALVFLKNIENPVESLSSEEIRGIYTGKIRNWKEVGGEDLPILAFQRNLNSGSQTLMEDLMMKGTPMMEAPIEFRPSEMGDLIDCVANYSNDHNAIGYSVYYYARNLKSDPQLRFMAVDGVMPESETIQSGEYQYTNPFYVAVRKDIPKDSHTWKLYQWLTGTDGQSLVEEMGYVSVSEGGRKLPESLTGQGQPAAANPVSEASRLAVNASMFDNNAGIIVFKNDFSGYDRISGVRIPDDKSYCLVRGSVMPACEPLYDLKEPEEDSQEADNEEGEEEFVPYYPLYMDIPVGLYDVDSQSWVVKPDKYDFIKIETAPDRNREAYYAGSWPEYYDDEGNEVPTEGNIDVYNALDGSLLETLEYKNEEEFYAILRNTDRETDTKMVYDDESQTNHLEIGNMNVYLQYGDEPRAWIEKDGEEIASATNGVVMPTMGFYYDDEYPEGWFYVNLYNLDEEYNVQDDVIFLIDREGEIRKEYSLKPSEGLVMCTEQYLLFRNYNSDRCRIEDYNGGILKEWILPNDYNWDADDE